MPDEDPQAPAPAQEPVAPAEGQATETPAEGGAAPAAADEPTLTYTTPDGESVTVRQSEAHQHWLRQQDYTRKTQALAEQREALTEAEALRAALEADPERTLNALYEAYELPAYTGQQQVSSEPEYVDPEEQRWQQFDQRLSAQEQANLEADIERGFQETEAYFGAENVDRNLLLAHMIENNIPDMFEAQKAILFDRLVSERQQQLAQQDQQIVAQKRDQNFVEGGHSAATGAVVPGEGAPVTDLRSAWRKAKQQLYPNQ